MRAALFLSVSAAFFLSRRKESRLPGYLRRTTPASVCAASTETRTALCTTSSTARELEGVCLDYPFSFTVCTALEFSVIQRVKIPWTFVREPGCASHIRHGFPELEGVWDFFFRAQFFVREPGCASHIQHGFPSLNACLFSKTLTFGYCARG